MQLPIGGIPDGGGPDGRGPDGGGPGGGHPPGPWGTLMTSSELKATMDKSPIITCEIKHLKQLNCWSHNTDWI